VKIVVGARSSPLSRAQVEEISQELKCSCQFEPIWIETTGDLDKKTSLRSLEKTDFFTKEIDALLLAGKIRIAIHSAKDLPDPLPKGLALIALTKGLDPRDSIVFRLGETLEMAKTIATSSVRREEMVYSLRPSVKFVDIRGTIQERLSALEKGIVDGVIIAEAALIRLQLTRLNRLILPGETAQNQGRLAIVGREGDTEMSQVFSCLDSR
jgi:hydroxymethylbilane synthase